MIAVAPGALLVLLTWVAMLTAVIGWGILPATLVDRSAPVTTLMRRALWWGLALISLVLIFAHLIVPLAWSGIPWIVIGGAVVSSLVAYRLRVAPRGKPHALGAWWFVIAALLVAQVALAFAALGSVTNYDTGLYHLGAIAYGREFATIPGLANVYGPLGYATTEFVWASALGSTPWGSESFRLVNGFLMLAVAADLVLRLKGTQRVGTYVLLVGIAATWGPFLGMADFWITSPTQDASALLLALVVCAYFVDVIAGEGKWINDAGIVLVASAVLVSVRSTMLVFAAASSALIIVLLVKRGRVRAPDVRTLAIVLMPFIFLLTLAITLRDYFLSGWLGYPLSILGFDVAWRAPDPTPLREATLGYHRDPTDISGALTGWEWIPLWIERLYGYWETYLVIALIIAVAGATAYALATGTKVPWRKILLATFPSFLAFCVWFVVSPPALRFIWGPLFGLLIIPLGWLIFAIISQRANVERILTMLSMGASVILLFASVATLAVRIEWDSMRDQRTWSLGKDVSYLVHEVPTPEVRARMLKSSLRILEPVDSDQCWARYPLCSPSIQTTLQLRGEGISAGFLP